MKKGYLLGILFFSALWGASEAILGGALYGAHIRYSSVPLAIIAFIILTVAKVYFPQKGSAILIASCAMLYKFFNAPFFACHLLAILLLGISYDVVYHTLKIKNKALFGLAATYLGYTLFALTITYVFRYHYWTEVGLPKIARYIGISGTMASLGNAVGVPVSFYLARSLKEKTESPFVFRMKLATGSISLITIALWVLGVTGSF